MSKLDPIDNGVRRFRPGLMMALCVFVLVGSAALVFQKVQNKQSDSDPPLPTTKISEEIEISDRTLEKAECNEYQI